MAALFAPGAMSPVSNELSLATMRWVTLSALLHVIDPLAGALGFGLNEFAARSPTIVT
jgi:hypothetical protein